MPFSSPARLSWRKQYLFASAQIASMGRLSKGAGASSSRSPLRVACLKVPAQESAGCARKAHCSRGGQCPADPHLVVAIAGDPASHSGEAVSARVSEIALLSEVCSNVSAGCSPPITHRWRWPLRRETQSRVPVVLSCPLACTHTAVLGIQRALRTARLELKYFDRRCQAALKCCLLQK